MIHPYFAVDALPQEIQETFDHLRQEIDDWMTLENAEIWEDFKVILEYEDSVTSLQPDIKLRFLCLLTKQTIKICSGERNTSLRYFYNFYFSWLAVRLIEAVSDYIDARLLRANKERLRVQWELASKSLLLVYTSNHRADELLRFLFTTLIPLAATLQPELKKHQQPVEQATQSPVTLNPPRVFAEAGSFALLLLNYSLAELEAMLVELGLLDPTTSRATQAATPGAWIGVIYALLEAERPRLSGSKAAIWRAFSGTFGAAVSERALQNGLGTQGSTAEQFRDRALKLLNA